MCGGLDQLKLQNSPVSTQEKDSFLKDMNGTVSLLLEFAADNDVEGFKRSVCDESEIFKIGLWYGHQRVLKKMVLEHRTPLMIAAKYGSVDVMKLILALPELDVNFSCGLDKSTALHCAVSGGSVNAVAVIKLLLLAGADPDAIDANGHRPFDVIVAPPNFAYLKIVLEELLKNNGSVCLWELQGSTNSFRSLSFSSEEGSLSSDSGSLLSSVTCKSNDAHICSAKKEYPVDPSLPDIKNSEYATDEFRMYTFKIWPCSRTYSHDWTECPFVHPGENARRRDPRKFHYSSVPCSDHRKGACGRGDLCQYSHGIFECWLHPAQYRTRRCKDGTSCTRRVCFFAHTSEELRPLYVSAVPSPRAAAMDFAATLSLLPASPSVETAMSVSPFVLPMSPSSSDAPLHMAWPQQNIPNSYVPGNNLQASHPRVSLNARDIPSEKLNGLQDFNLQQQLQFLDEVLFLSQPNQSDTCTNLSTQLNPSNLDKLLHFQLSSPQYINRHGAAYVFSPSYKSTVLTKVQQWESMICPIKTNCFSQKTVDHPLLKASFSSSSPRINVPVSPVSSQSSTLAIRVKMQQPLQNLSAWELGSSLAHDLGSNRRNSWSKWESANGNADWSVQADEMHSLWKSGSTGHYGELPDVSWVQAVLKESPSETKETAAIPASGTIEGSSSNTQNEPSDHAALRAWLDGLQLDQIVA